MPKSNGISMEGFMTELDNQKIAAEALSRSSYISRASIYSYNYGKFNMPIDVARDIQESVRKYIKHLEKCIAEIDVKIEAVEKRGE